MSAVNALTVDVEDYFHVSAFAGSISRDDWSTLPARVERNTYRLLELFDDRGVVATFFVLGWVAERYPDLIRAIHRQGHEVACHGLSHQLIYKQSKDVFKTETVRAKDLLEDLITAPVHGYRAASYSITPASLWAMDVIAGAGFLYDSSIAPTRHDLYGLPGAEPNPHRFVTESGAQIVEYPVSTVSLFGFRFPVGGGYFRLYPYWLTTKLLRRLREREGAPFMFYLHPWEIDPEQPRIEAKLLSQFRHYLNLDKTENRLIRLLDDFEFGTVRAVLGNLRLLASEYA